MTNEINLNQPQVRSSFYQKGMEFDFSSRVNSNQAFEIKEEMYEQSSVYEKAPETDLSKFDYNEYFEYCKANAVSNTPDSGKTVVDKTQGYESVRIMNFGKALGSYANTNVNYSTSQISSYA